MVSLRELKDQAFDVNEELAADLTPADLFFELDFTADRIREVQQLFGRIAAQQLRWVTPDEFIKRYPALTLVALNGHAALDYGDTGYWETFWQEVRLDPSQDFEIALRRALEWMFDRYRMRPLSDVLTRQRYVGALAVHAGIPVNRIPNLVGVIERYAAAGYALSGSEFFQWVTEQGKTHRAYELGVPVQDFLLLGGEIAVEVLERIMELLEFTVDRPDDWHSEDLSRETTGLPTLWLEALVEHLTHRPFGSGQSDRVRRPRRRRPTLRYSVDDEQVMVEVPYPHESAEEPWEISYSGQTRKVYARAEWGIDSADEQPPTPVAVTRRTREVVLSHPSGREESVPVVDAADPVLLFTVTGRALRTGAVLPRDEIIAVLPGNADLVDVAGNAALTPLGRAAEPTGWDGWQTRRYDLRGHDGVRLRQPGKPAGPVHGVRPGGAPVITAYGALAGVRTPDGLPVYGRRPQVELPAFLGTEAQQWRVVVRDSGDRRKVADETWDSAETVAYLDPFDDIAPGLLGRFEIEISEAGRSATGTAHRQTVFLAEGLQIEYDDEFRLPVPGGLSPITASLSVDGPLQIDRRTMVFTPETKDDVLTVSGAGAFKLVVGPPHFVSRVDRAGTPANWGIAVKQLAPKDLSDLWVIGARVPAATDVDFVLHDQDGQVVQQQTATSPVDGVYQVSSQLFHDSAVRRGTTTVVARVDDSQGQTFAVPVLALSPAAMFEQVRLSGRDLVFTGLADGEYHSAWIWSVTAPWRTVVPVEIEDGRATVPAPLRGAGDLLVQVFIDDPFEIVPRPDGPDGSAQRVHQSGWADDQDADLGALARFLAGEGPVPTGAGAVRGAWAALAVLPWYRDEFSDATRAVLLELVRQHPRVAIDELGHSAIRQSAKTALMIESGLSQESFAAEATFNELHPDPWVGSLVEISDLTGLLYNGDSVPGETAQTLEYLTDKGGRWLIDLLSGDGADGAAIGVFRSDVVALDAMDNAQIAAVFAEARLVPGALLDEDTRTTAVADAFSVRHSWSADPAATELTEAALRLRPLLHAEAPHAAGFIDARDAAVHGEDAETHGWVTASATSLTVALVDRLAARSLLDPEVVPAPVRRAWTTMATYFPDMTATDLLIADALASYQAFDDLIGELR